MPKQDIHPTWYDETQVYCDGQLIMTTSSTKPNLYVDIWSGNHPFYTGSLKILNFCISLISRMNNDFDNAKAKNNKIIPSTMKILFAS